ncbi:MAG: EamA family transporter [Ferruginibacter sp.]
MKKQIQQSSRAKAYIALFITSIVWGTTWVASKMAVAELPALQMAGIRQFIAGVLLVGFFILHKKLSLPTAKEFRWLLVMALLMFVFANGLSTWGVKFIPAGMASLIGTLYPLSVVIIEAVFYRQRNFSVLTIIGMFLGITGVGIVFYENAFHHSGSNYVWGLILSVLAMLSWSFGTVFMTRNKRPMNPYYATGWQMLLSSVILYLVAAFTSPTQALTAISFKAWGLILYLVVFGSILTFVAFIYSMKKLPVALASLYAYINPLVAMLVGALLLDEKLTLYIFWGAVVTLSGVFLVNYSIRRSRAKLIAEPEL